MSDMTGTGNVDKAPDAFRTISEVADDLDVPQHVLRFWETRFNQIKPMKRGGGRRYYRPDDVDLLRGIRHLLYGEGYTIRGVQRILKDNGLKFVQSVWRSGAPQPEPPRAEDAVETEDRAESAVADAAEREERPAARAGRAPAGAPAVQGAKPPPAAALSREDLARLQSTLHELGECRRLLEGALKDE
jgi:DNA-binding transcriptional MerR regulator